MKHSEILAKVKEVLNDKEFSLISLIKKGSISGMNYLSVKFDSEDSRNVIMEKINARPCEKRYGIGLTITPYSFKK